MRIDLVKESPVRVWRPVPGVLMADFGRDAYGRLEVIFKNPLNGAPQLAVGEVLNADGTLNRHPGGSRRYHQMTIGPERSPGSVMFDFPHHLTPYVDYQRSKVLTPEIARGEVSTFRYAQIYNVDDYNEIEFVRHTIYGAFDDNAADFQSSDTALNELWDFTKYTMKATSAFGLYIDGDRERQCFDGDMLINALGAYCTGGGYEIARRTLDFLIEFYPMTCLEYRLLQAPLVEDYILYSGDEVMYRYWMDSLKVNLEPIFAMRDNRGLIRGEKIANLVMAVELLIDWPPNQRDNYERGEFNFAPNAFLYATLKSLAKLDPAGSWAADAKNLRTQIRKVFLKNNLFVDNAESSHTALHSAMWAVWFGLADAAELPAIRKLLAERGMACSVYGAQFLLDAEFQIGMEQTAIDQMRSRGERSWLGMKDHGATMTMEAWSDAEKPNQDWSHAWGAAPANIIPRRLCGIRPAAPGFKEFVVDPKPGNVAEWLFRMPTPHGEIKLEKSAQKYQLTVPEGTTANAAGRTLGSGKHELEIRN